MTPRYGRPPPTGQRQMRATAGLALVGAVVLATPVGLHAPTRDATGPGCDPSLFDRARTWSDDLLRGAPRTEPEALAWVNAFWNRAMPRRSEPHAAASILADERRHMLARYLSLRALGVPAARLRLVYAVVDALPEPRRAAMVLGYYPEPAAVPLVLRAHAGQVLSAETLPALTPLVHSDGLALIGTRTGGDAAHLPSLLCRLMSAEPDPPAPTGL